MHLLSAGRLAASNGAWRGCVTSRSSENRLHREGTGWQIKVIVKASVLDAVPALVVTEMGPCGGACWHLSDNLGDGVRRDGGQVAVEVDFWCASEVLPADRHGRSGRGQCRIEAADRGVTSVAIRPIESFTSVVNHTAPSGPAVISKV
jgi:hypothetical protein